MQIWEKAVLLWLSWEYVSIGWQILFSGAPPFAPIGLLVSEAYRRLLGPLRWTKVWLDTYGTLGELLLVNLTTLGISLLVLPSTLASRWMTILLLAGVVSQLLENLTWSISGLKPFFRNWELRVDIFADAESDKLIRERDRVRAEIRDFAPSHILPYLLGRIIIAAIMITIAFTMTYRLMLITDPSAFTDAGGNPVRSDDVSSLLAYSTNLTTHGDSDLKAVTSDARLLHSLHRVSNTFLFTLLISAVVTISQEEIKLRKEELLKRLSDDGPVSDEKLNRG